MAQGRVKLAGSKNKAHSKRNKVRLLIIKFIAPKRAK